MNKQELIDKCVHHYMGDWPYSEPAIIYNRITGNFSSYSDSDFENLNAHCWAPVCTKEEFQQRARELGYGAEAVEPERWYCYETKKALRLPPVGVEVIALDDIHAKIIGQTASGYLVYQSVETGFCEMACQTTSFKPIDWNRKAEIERERVIDAAFASLTEFNKAHQVLRELYDAGFLRMPEDK